MLLSKGDLLDFIDDGVKLPDVKAKAKELHFTSYAKVSSKAWEDFNVHRAFNKALKAAYLYKYMGEEDSDSDD